MVSTLLCQVQPAVAITPPTPADWFTVHQQFMAAVTTGSMVLAAAIIAYCGIIHRARQDEKMRQSTVADNEKIRLRNKREVAFELVKNKTQLMVLWSMLMVESKLYMFHAGASMRWAERGNPEFIERTLENYVRWQKDFLDTRHKQLEALADAVGAITTFDLVFFRDATYTQLKDNLFQMNINTPNLFAGATSMLDVATISAGLETNINEIRRRSGMVEAGNALENYLVENRQRWLA